MSQFSAPFSAELNHAIATYKAGKLVEAEQYCQQIIEGQPDFFDAFNILAVIQLKLRKYEAALASFDRIIALRPNYALAHYQRGNALQSLRRFEEALASYDSAISLRSNFALAHVARGNILQQLGRYDEALVNYDRALALRPDFSDVYSDRGNALKELNRHTEALASYDRAIALRPNLAVTHYNRGNVLQDLLRFDDALVSYEQAIALRPDFPEAFSNRGNVLQRLKRFEEAVASYDRAIAMRPNFSDAFSNRGAALQELRCHDEAVTSYSQAWKIQPDYADAQYNEALCRLVVGDFARGWELQESRWKTAQLRNAKRNFAQPLWLGDENISAKTILLHSEQGFGDTIQFCRYVPLVAARGAHVILDVQVPLTGLMGSLTGTTQVVSAGSVLSDFDFHCPLLSLPLAFGTRLETIPSAVPYLHASPDQIKMWDIRLGPKTRPRVGLAWSGRPTHQNDHNRTIPLSAFLPLLEIDATFISLQKYVRVSDATILEARSDILHFGAEIKDFSDTAALASNMDLIISADTSSVHIAGALAKPVWILLPFTPDWRWLLDRDDSPWYPTARLFRQSETRAWESVMVHVRSALSKFIQHSPEA